MELLNSKRNHKDYMCDRARGAWSCARRSARPNFKLLYDIYHMQIRKATSSRRSARTTIFRSLSHRRRAGSQRDRRDAGAVLSGDHAAIVDTGYKGIVAQEFIPERDPMTSLAQAIKICDV